MSYAQEYIDHAWCELTIPATEKGEYAMDGNHLHIWPRHSFMMIALPNRVCFLNLARCSLILQDKSFTVTLFMPWDKFEAIKTKEDLLSFFEATFPDSLPVMGKDLLIGEYFKNPKGSLISIKVRIRVLMQVLHSVQPLPLQRQGRDCRRFSTRNGTFLRPRNELWI